MYRKLLGLLLIVMISIAMVACSDDGTPNNNDQNNDNNAVENNDKDNKSSNNDEEEELNPKVDGKYDPPVTLTTVKAVAPDLEFREGESIEDNIYTRLVKEHLGIDIEFLWTTPVLDNAFETKLMLSLSAGDELPDVLNVPSLTAQQLIDSGKFRPVGDLFEKYAGENWKLAASQAEVDWLPYLRDGKKYAIPSYNYKYENEPVMWIRQDWLDHLNLEAPKTISELEEVMDAFTNDDPDGNGEDDTIGLALKMDEPALTVDPKSWVRSNWIFGTHGALPGQWDVQDNGEVIYGSLQPEIKEGLGTLNDWFNKGYLHPEFALHNEMKASELFTSGKAGIIVGSSWLWAWPLNALADVNPDAVLQSYPVPTGDDGTLQLHGLLNHYNVTLINKEMEDPEIYFTLQNFFYDNYANPEAGGLFENGLAEGYDWAVVDGEIVTTDKEIPGGMITGKDYALDPQIARIPELQFSTLVKLGEGHEPETPFEKKLARNAGKNEQSLRTAKMVLDQEKYVVQNAYLGAPTETMKENSDYLIKLEQETFNKIIYGDLPLDAFDDYVDNFMSTGGEEITAEVQEWYDSNIK